MQVLETIQAFKEARRAVTGTLGLAPTMGYLHEGHLELVRRARAENDAVAVSIFVNPTQFGPNEDFTRYPRDPERDLQLLSDAGTDLVFLPTPDNMYPPGFNTWVDVQGVTERLEGAHRPGHFRGVATVVAKLFNIVEPTRAYFGQKDAQQVVVIRKMVEDLCMNLDIVVCPTVREADGLAKSSRNVYLQGEERLAAVYLSRSLQLAEKLWSEGETSADRIRARMTHLLHEVPLLRIDYVSLADPRTLEEVSEARAGVVISLAAQVGRTRLIDNCVLGA